MAVGKYSRQEKRMPSFYIMVSSLMFIAFCLVAMWVFGSPMKGGVDPNRITPSDSKGLMTKSQNENMSLDESTGESLQDNDENLDDAIPNENRVTRSVSLTSDNSKNDQPGVDKDEGSLLDKLKGKDKADDEEAAEKGDEDGLVNVSGEPEKRESEGATTAKEEKLADSSDGGEQLETQVGNTEDAGSWDTQVSESREEKEIIKKNDLKKQKEEAARPLKEVTDSLKNLEEGDDLKQVDGGQSSLDENESEWSICNGTDYIPCLDNLEAIKKLHSTKHYQHRERHCPEERPLCLVPIPEGYEDHSNFPWPQSRDQISYKNVPHLGLVSYKKDQNWVKRKGDRLVFPGGGTQFKHGALHYIDFVEKVLPDIAWGKHTRVILDVGCGVASFGGYLFDKDVLTMSFAPKDEHEAQVQFALERGIPAISAVMGTQRLVFPSNVYDAVHCARCRVPWHIEGGKLLLELNRVLRPGGVFIWSATPVYWKGEEDVSIWKEMVSLTASMCWNLLTRTTDVTTGVGVAIFKKPITNNCYEHRKQNKPPICEKEDKPDAAWYVNMTACIHKVPSEKGVRGIEWPVNWPQRLTVAPSWLSDKELSNGKSAAAAFASDTANWQKQVQGNYFQVGIDWSKIRNVMDMRAVYGGFAAALATQQVWVVNVVPVDAPDTLPVIFDRGLFGIYHDWCESFSTYPRTYDLLHADYLFTKLRKRCGEIRGIIVEVDRILRPMGWFIVRDESDNLQEIKVILKSLHWDVADTKHDGLLVAQKKMWRPMAAF